MKNRKKEVIILAIVLIIQTIIYVICGINKSYIHMDEAYSLNYTSNSFNNTDYNICNLWDK